MGFLHSSIPRAVRVDIGYLCGIAAFVMWGLLPVYWKQLDAVPSLQLVAHRVVWSSLTFVPLLWWWGGWRQVGGVLGRPGVLARHLAAAVLVSANWLGFVWGVTHGRMIECSLGYYLTPLVSVLLGVTVLRERLRPAQWVAVGIAAAGVAWITAGYHEFPWIAIFLATTFSGYALVKKKGSLAPLPSLALETMLLLLPAIGYLAAQHAAQRGGFGSHGAATDLLLAMAGPATVAPLLCFSVAVRRIPLSTVGLLQYIGPTLQFLVGALIYGEPFDQTRLVGFGIVWSALVLFAIDSLRHSVARRRSLDNEKITP
jgi:chloramphenicol-sensitive protein RarD